MACISLPIAVPPGAARPRLTRRNKTVQEASFTRRMLNQLIGYYILHVIGGIGELDPKPTISRVGIYFARRAQLSSFDLAEVIDRETFSDTVEWFARYGIARHVRRDAASSRDGSESP